MTPAAQVIPPPVLRRLLLSLWGWRFAEGIWSRGGQRLTEEQVDTMSARRWAAFIRRWATSAMN
jgi:hypothetical protein